MKYPQTRAPRKKAVPEIILPEYRIKECWPDHGEVVYIRAKSWMIGWNEISPPAMRRKLFLVIDGKPHWAEYDHSIPRHLQSKTEEASPFNVWAQLSINDLKFQNYLFDNGRENFQPDWGKVKYLSKKIAESSVHGGRPSRIGERDVSLAEEFARLDDLTEE